MTEALPVWFYSPEVADSGGGGCTGRCCRPTSSCNAPLPPNNSCCLKSDGTRSKTAKDIPGNEKYGVSSSCREHFGGFAAELMRNRHDQERAQLSFLALLLAAVRRSLLVCKATRRDISLQIGCPTNVRHVTHVTFDRFSGFLGLPLEFEVEIPRKVPSASASVFGVSAESMQCSYDRKGNSVPTILLLIQERLYSRGGLQIEGIFRINAENSHEEQVRQQLNKGILPHGVDLHCLAGLIKAWFRELPKGVLDSLAPADVMQCSSEEEYIDLVKQLPQTESALLDWAVNLMADVAQSETTNKMNARNIAMVFAPNMTKMVDPLTALMHAVQVMNLLKTLILRTIRERQEVALDPMPMFMCSGSPFDNDFDEDTGSPFFLGCRALKNIDEEMMQETLMAPFNSPNRKGSPNVGYSADELGEVYVFELNERHGFIDSIECEDCLPDGLSSVKSSKACKGENNERANITLVYPDNDETRTGDKVMKIRNQCSVIVRPKRSNKYQSSDLGHRTGSIKW